MSAKNAPSGGSDRAERKQNNGKCVLMLIIAQGKGKGNEKKAGIQDYLGNAA